LAKTVRASAAIAAPAAVIFACLADYKQADVFIEGLEQLTPNGSRTVGQGARFDAVLKVATRTLRTTIEIAALEPDRLITWSSAGDDGQRLTFRLSAGQGETIVELTVDYEEPGGVAGALMAPFIAQVVQHRSETALARLREQVSEPS
jgi:uncharacterized membrane protein